MPVLSPAGHRTRTDLDQLQGAWTTVAGNREARLLVTGRRFAFEFVGGDIYMGTFVLDPGADPRQMDMLIEAGPLEHKDLIALCIYHVEDGTLRWCPTRPGSVRRLAAFPALDDTRYFSLVFRQERPGRGHLRPARLTRPTAAPYHPTRRVTFASPPGFWHPKGNS